MRRAPIRPAVIALAVALLAACVPPTLVPTAPPEAGVPAGFPDELYRRAAERGEPVYRIEQQHSQAVIYAYHGGRLARFGHDHVITSREVHGYIRAPSATSAGSADLYVPLASLSVDEPARRAQAGFATELSTADIASTRRNMLEKVLEAAQHPFVVIHVEGVPDSASAPVLTAEVTLHGVTRTLRVPAELERSGGELGVRGGFSLQQTDFGITPYSVLGGALQVQDRVDVRFEIRARRVAGAQ